MLALEMLCAGVVFGIALKLSFFRAALPKSLCLAAARSLSGSAVDPMFNLPCTHVVSDHVVASLTEEAMAISEVQTKEHFHQEAVQRIRRRIATRRDAHSSFYRTPSTGFTIFPVGEKTCGISR